MRIGSYGNLGEVYQNSAALQDTFGRRVLLLPMGADSVTKFRIAVEVPVGVYTKTLEVFDPPEWQGERDLSVSDSLLAGTLTADNFPLARGKPGEDTPVTYASGAVGFQKRFVVDLESGSHQAKASSGAGASGSGGPVADAAKDEAAAANQEKKRLKRQRQKQEITPEAQEVIKLNKMQRGYSFCLRVSYISTMRCPVNYYSVPGEMWVPPEPGKPYSENQVCQLISRHGKGTPTAKAGAETREVAAVAARRQHIAAVQQTETVESLSRVGNLTSIPEEPP